MNMPLFEDEPRPKAKFPAISIDLTGVHCAQDIASEIVRYAHLAATVESGDRNVHLFVLMLRDAADDVYGLGSVRASTDWCMRRALIQTAAALETDEFWCSALNAMWWAMEPDAYRQLSLLQYYEQMRKAYSVRVGKG